MLKLTQQQLDRLGELEQLQYVEEVRKLAIAQQPELAADAGLSDRLERAYRDGRDLGLQQGDAMTQFLYLEALTPGFYRQPPIGAWLARPGRSPEQRLADLMSATKTITKGR